LFAGEPDVVQPIAMCFDQRGRLWVAECLSYPKWHKDLTKGRDRILIFEDTDNDGTFDKRTVFHDKMYNLSGIQVGFDGVWVCATPHLLFIPDKDGDDVPDGPPEVLLDGWDTKAIHNVFNGLNWGPDGWLYGCHGITVTVDIGRPGEPIAKRKRMNCGVWRYHPTRKVFEVVAHGTTNPWGIDWDEHGQMFVTNCVIDHLWHIVPGGHYERMHGQDLNPHIYGLMKSVCDHSHWGGGHWTTSRGGQGVHSEAGGGHAHSGILIYQGDNFPARYRNTVFMCNLHGNRLNNDILERKGSTYVARHGKDFMLANDPWFRGIALCSGPDGAMYVCDWCDTGECHNYEVAHTTTGRIHKIMYGKPKNPADTFGKNWDLSKLPDAELVKLQLHKDEWYVRQARRVLQERAAEKNMQNIKDVVLEKLFAKSGEQTSIRVRYLWTAYVIGSLDTKLLEKCLYTYDENIRYWGIRLASDEGKIDDEFLKSLATSAAIEASPRVRLAIASTLRNLPLKQFVDVATSLLKYHDESTDPFLPHVIWYSIAPLIPEETEGAEFLMFMTRTPLVREFIARGRASHSDKMLENLVIALADDVMPPWFHRDLLRGIQQATTGRRSIPMPLTWKLSYPTLVESPLPEVRERALALAVQFGDDRALEALRKTVLDAKTPSAKRQSSLATLVFHQSKNLLPILHDLLDDLVLRSQAIKGLAAFDDPKTPPSLLERYAKLSEEEKAGAVHTLASRPAYALALLDAVDKKQVPRADISPFTARQIQALNHKEASAKLEKVWGTIRPAAQDKTKLMAKYKSALKPEVQKQADLKNGRLLYNKHCANCHRLFGEGSPIGPDLTGSQRMNLDYLLENMLDPSAVVPRDYQVWVVATTGGRTITGIIKEETDRALTVQTQNELIVLPKDEVESRTLSNVSMMPEGQLDPLTIEEVRDLVGYLKSPEQVPIPKK
ncbi:MAG: c-type cytochrome, partial [Gemmataceae bacterium]|nr:c-type cytochrome [Gemmataceae bacterium]